MNKEIIIKLLRDLRGRGEFKIKKIDGCYTSSDVKWCFLDGSSFYGVFIRDYTFSGEKLNKLYENKLIFKEFTEKGELQETNNIDFHTQVFYKDVYIGSVSDLLYLYLNGVKEFISHEIGKTELGYAGWTYRGFFYEFRKGDQIRYDPDLIILSHGYIEGIPEYEEEKQEIKKVKSMFKNGILTINTDEQALFLAKRYSRALSSGVLEVEDG